MRLVLVIRNISWEIVTVQVIVSLESEISMVDMKKVVLIEETKYHTMHFKYRLNNCNVAHSESVDVLIIANSIQQIKMQMHEMFHQY